MKLRTFDNTDEQGKALANQVARDIEQQLKHKDRVNICVPGGKTPSHFFNALSEIELEWSRVEILLSDERWVAVDHRMSNEALLRSNLAKNAAQNVRILPYYHSSMPVNEAIHKLGHEIERLMPLDICVLGMGEDGHTASLFPNMHNLESALDVSEPYKLVIADLPGESVLRISLNMTALLSATRHYILIRGQSKKAVIDEADKQMTTRLPISHLLANCPLAEVYYCQ